jgi:hypothetical protein
VPYLVKAADLVKARRNETLRQRAESAAFEAWFHLKHTLPDVFADIKKI